MSHRAEEPFLNLDNSRYKDQRRVMERLVRQGGCPFCPDGIAEQERRGEARPVIRQGTYWHVRHNNWPYDNTRIHLLLIHNQHAEQLADISPEAAQELIELAQWIEGEFAIEGGGFGMRFGDIRHNGASVRHLHAHVLTARVTDMADPDYKLVLFRVG